MHPPLNIDERGDTVFCWRRGFRYACGPRHQSNDPARCVRFHGTLFLIYSPSLSQNSPTPNSLWHKHSPLRKAKRHGTWYVRVTYHLRTASVRFVQKSLITLHHIEQTETTVQKVPHVVPCSVHMYIDISGIYKILRER